jgi:hypothetical protein
MSLTQTKTGRSYAAPNATTRTRHTTVLKGTVVAVLRPVSETPAQQTLYRQGMAGPFTCRICQAPLLEHASRAPAATSRPMTAVAGLDSFFSSEPYTMGQYFDR